MRLRAERWFDVVAAVLCFAAWWVAEQSTRDLTWPCESDFFRDLGAAQTLLDGGIGSDPGYSGERWWYSPLVPGLLAVASRVTRLPLPEAYATLGVHLNLLAPVAFYALLAVLFRRGVALAGLVGFLFLGQLDLMSWLNATYSPWLWPCNFAQAFFYSALGLVIWAFKTRSRRWAIAAGAGVGLTALAHAAPALLLGGVCFVLAITQIGLGRLPAAVTRQTLLVFAVISGVALLLAAPFYGDVLVRYHGAIQNPAPLQWVAGELAFGHSQKTWLRLLSLRGVLAVIGLVSLLWLREPEDALAKRALFTWGVVAAAGLGYGFAAQQAHLPPLLPSWHFYFYLQALESVLFGLGVLAVARQVARRLSWAAPIDAMERVMVSVSVAAMLVFILLRFERYQSRPDLVANRRDSLNFAAAPAAQLYGFILGHTKPGDVILADPGTSLFAILPAGRRSVALPAIFSNPYVDFRGRAADSTAMLKHLQQGRWEAFAKLSRAYQVRYVALPAKQRHSLTKRLPPELKRIYSSKDRSGSDLYELGSGR